MKGIFVTGTDTDVGKTALCALLLAELRRRGINAAPMKPVQTGCVNGVPDLDYALAMAQMSVSAEDYANMSPYPFEPACSPHLAAEMAGIKIGLAKITTAAQTLASEYEFVIAEGAGGIIVPLNRHETMLDLMQALQLPVLLAARPGLGTINHTLLSIRALRSAGLNIAGIVFVVSTDDKFGLIEEDNAATIAQFSNIPVLGTIPYCVQLAGPNPTYSTLPIPVITETEKIINQLIL